MTLTPEQRDELRALAEKATPGEWQAYSFPGERNVAPYCAVEVGDTEVQVTRFEGGWFDAALIAAMRNALPGLLDALDTAEAARDTAERQVKAVRDVLARWEARGLAAPPEIRAALDGAGR